MLESIQSMSLLGVMEILGPMVLAAALLYGIMQWARRPRGATEAVREEATRQLYREGAKEKEVELDPAPPRSPEARQRPAPTRSPQRQA
jgi:hypothetical protein